MNLYSRMRQLKIAGKLPKKEEINSVFKAFSKKEKMVFVLLFLTLCISTLLILQSINKSLMTEVPFRGGSVSEGIIGTARFINPVLAISPADQDMVSLVYSGLMRKNPDGTVTPDLAEKYEMSNDGLTYTFTLRDKIYFHDGKPVTADDVVFTVSEAKDSIIKSPRQVDWDGGSIAKIDERTVQFSLRQPFPSFLENE